MALADATLANLPSGGALHVVGPVGAAPVLFIHGVGGAAWSWGPQVEALRPAYRLFVLEERGHGSAARVADAGIADYFADAAEGLGRALEEAQRPVTVVGHSLGGFLAIALAARLSAAVRGLFLIDPVNFTGDDRYSRIWVLSRWFAPLLSRAIGTETFAHWMFRFSFENRDRLEAAWPLQFAQVPIEYPRILAEAFSGPVGFELRDYASEVHDPTYLLEGSSGSRRPHFPALVQTLRERLAETFVYESIPGGHYLQLDSPDAVNQRLRTFLEKYAA